MSAPRSRSTACASCARTPARASPTSRRAPATCTTCTAPRSRTACSRARRSPRASCSRSGCASPTARSRIAGDETRRSPTMAWDFSTEPEFQRELDWMTGFVREHVEPLDLVFDGEDVYPKNGKARRVIRPLQQQVKERGLWACHLGPELGGLGFGQLKLALINEILGRSAWAPLVFGCQAPDTGNAEIIAHYGTAEQKKKFLRPLLEGEIFSCYSMTEPHAGADPKMFKTRAVRDGDSWVINGEKWFSS